MKGPVSTKWIDGMAFEVNINGHKFTIDAVEEVGGKNRGPQPKPFMLAALGGCTAMDIVSILSKMRVEVTDFEVLVDGKLTDEHPKHYQSMHIQYVFTGSNLPMDKLQKAVELSQDRYCGVSASYKKAMEITYEIIVKEG